MLFNSYLFITLFLPVVLGGFAMAASWSPVAAKVWLICASLTLYASWDPVFVPFLAASMVGNLIAVRIVERLEPRPDRRDVVLVLAMIANLAGLFWCRYLPAWLPGLSAIAQADWHMADPIVPLGLSFFTFTQIGYLLDRRAGVAPTCRALDYVLFVSFFPSLTAGPILSGREVLPQFASLGRLRLSGDSLAIGLGLFLIGCLKKTLLADPLGATVSAGFAEPSALGAFGAWQVALSWTLQLYFDFSGYSDMAIGLARMVGLHYPLNFNSPYKAESVIEYWQRWHMSLTRFFMGAIHAPLTMAIMRRRRAQGLGTGREAQRSYAGFACMVAVPIAVTMTLAGVWHGAAATFLLFGLLHAGFLIVNHAWRLFRPAPRSRAPVVIAARVGLTHACVLIGAVLFRASSADAAGALLGAMAGLNSGMPEPVTLRGLVDGAMLAVLYGIVWAMPNSQTIMTVGHAAWGWRPSWPWAVAFGCAATLCLLSMGGTAEFVYFQF